MSFALFVAPAVRTEAELTVRAGDPLRFHRAMPGYQPTPLYSVPALAEELGVASVLVKDESTRLGLPSFKMLGASWATARAIAREWFPELGDDLSLDRLTAAIGADSGRALAAATDGNHGRGVARMAKLLGLHCRIFVPSGTAQSRIDAIASEGASVEVVDGTYDDAIARSAQEADAATLVISDTSWPGYVETPTDVIRGYSTMFREIDECLERSGIASPDLVCFQSGVGSFAAAGLEHYRSGPSGSTVTTVVVEPTAADCLMRSARNGDIAEAPGPHPSTMAGLNCGLPSLLAWPIVFADTDVYLSVDDRAAHEGMRRLAEVGIVAGESGAATVGALLSAVGDPDARRALGLSADTRVLLVNTEGATDPVNFVEQVGVSPDEVEATASARRERSGTVRL